MPSLDRIRIERRAIAPHETLVLAMSFPPSLNNLFPGKEHRYESKEYRAWQLDNKATLLSGDRRRVPGPVHILLEYEDAGRKDLDNLQKAVFDLLVDCNVIDGDGRAVVRAFTAKWVSDVQGVRITISPIRQERVAA